MIIIDNQWHGQDRICRRGKNGVARGRREQKGCGQGEGKQNGMKPEG